MRVYEVFSNDIKIGVLTINSNNRYKYEVDKKGLSIARKNTPIFYQLSSSTDGFVDSIPCLYNRISNCERFDKKQEVNYPEDDIKLKLISSED